MTVPTGWWHQVKNVAPCFKIAWDLWRNEDYAAYIDLLKHVANANMLPALAHDYQSIEPVLVSSALVVATALHLDV